ncbi:hypothetical protein O6H91_19G065300 [Diphasiastrum complanatum]|uniref:Uncharacterized protein n=1 Tax=Diphasiastrum complanatum TaxID=34168 RepID=A0ACC2AW36_DIPCM|nr:hypothetical protein O6H91_19G065300 [Diphasiastrum complanatum]
MSATSQSAPESSSTSASTDPEYGKLIFHGKVTQGSPHIGTETVSSSRQVDDVENLISNNALLSRLKPQSTHMVDLVGIKEDTMGVEHVEPSLFSSRQFSLSISEAASHAKLSQEILYARNRNKSHSDLSLSLGLCNELNFNTSGLESSSFVYDRRTSSLPFESVRMLAQQKRAITPGSHEENSAASKRLKAMESPAAQLTIFYDGAVHIYNDVPQDRAKAIMLLAESANAGSSQSAPQSVQTRFATQSPISNPSPYILKHSSALDTVHRNAHDSGRSSASACKALSGLQPTGNVSYTALPQARRISLHRFLRKRTERTRAVSPNVANQNMESALALRRSRSSSPSATNCRAASPAALLSRSPCRPASAYGDYTCTLNNSNEVSITSS